MERTEPGDGSEGTSSLPVCVRRVQSPELQLQAVPEEINIRVRVYGSCPEIECRAGWLER